MKKLLLLLLCCGLFFCACGKDKTIEKIIYGDKVSSILDKQEFDKVPVFREFNNTEDLLAYINQCYQNKTNISGKKLKVKGLCSLHKYFYANDPNHYYNIRGTFSSSSSPSTFRVDFVDTDKNIEPPSEATISFTCIVTEVGLYNSNSFYSYSYGYTIE